MPAYQGTWGGADKVHWHAARTGSSLAVEGLTWGRAGPFAFNMWIKQVGLLPSSPVLC